MTGPKKTRIIKSPGRKVDAGSVVDSSRQQQRKGHVKHPCIVSGQGDFPAQDIVDEFVSVQPTADFDEMEAILRGDKTSNRFDANRYFTVLRALRPDKAQVLDWVYCNNGLGGFPVLYMRKAQSKPFSDYEKFAEQTKKFPSETALPEFVANEDIRFGYIEKIHVEDSPEGFFQFVVLMLLGDRFYLFWHELVNKTFLVCSKIGWQALLEREKKRGKPYDPPPSRFITAAEKLDFSPRIRIGTEQVEVSVTTYSPFGGLDCHCFTISRRYPHRILKQSRTDILEHHQTFVF